MDIYEWDTGKYMGKIPQAAHTYNVIGNVIAYVSTRFSMLSQLLKFLTVDQVFQVLMPISLIIGIGIGFFGSFSTVRKHIRV